MFSWLVSIVPCKNDRSKCKTKPKAIATIRVFLLQAKPVVLNRFYISYPLVKQDYQIYSQYTQWCSYIENESNKLKSLA